MFKVIFFLLMGCIGALLALFDLCIDELEDKDNDDTAKGPAVDDEHRR